MTTESATKVDPEKLQALALGAHAGETRLRDVVMPAGFSRFRRAAETLFNLVLEARA